jgi:hypothetical protein
MVETAVKARDLQVRIVHRSHLSVHQTVRCAHMSAWISISNKLTCIRDSYRCARLGDGEVMLGFSARCNQPVSQETRLS